MPGKQSVAWSMLDSVANVRCQHLTAQPVGVGTVGHIKGGTVPEQIKFIN